MENGTLVWGILLCSGVLLVFALGFFYPYVSKGEKRKAEKSKLHRMNVPRVHIKERYNFKIRYIVSAIISTIAFLCLCMSDELNDFIVIFPFYTSALCIAGLIVITIAVSFAQIKIAEMGAGLKIKSLYAYYRNKYDSEIVNQTRILH